ncbi:Short C-terminal domain-containing protein [Agromyces sp. CF514]|uniref:SHOCT domain-containing protein n=1 Tax=Agromyces sp. CF514 TaxID=1881031 RepID=UPI0008F424F9|nr:SHOCT domain-containing protein [Agromyces sp. CF514]SFR66385.1 Short C-terminal domain-containing protein [Agromyces sp. CF514]
MIRRMGRPGLIGMAARTAVVAGTATAVSGSVQRHQQEKYQQQAQADAYEQQQQQAQMDAAAQQAAQQAFAQQQYAQQQAAAAAPPAAAPAVDIVAELQKLGALKEQGILSDAEFAAAKAKLLG